MSERIELPLDNEQESIDRIAWLVRNVCEVEKALAAILEAGPKAFGNYEIILLNNHEFALEWIEFGPSHRYRAMKRLGMPVVITTHTSSGTHIAPN